jgi:D-allose transport system substrate-binding protein
MCADRHYKQNELFMLKGKSKSILLSLLSFAAFVTVFATDTSAYATENYIFILPSLGNPYWQTVKQGIEDGGKETGIRLTVLSAMSDQAKEEHLNLCQSAISQKPSIIVLCTTTTAVGLQCLREAQNQGIKVAVLDAMISVEEAKKSGVDLSFSVGTNNVLVGERAAQFIAANSKLAAPKTLILEGMVGNINSSNRVSGFKQELAKDLPKAVIVNSVSAEWDRLRALNITADTLTRTPDLNVVFAANDMMALGAVEAIRAAGKTNQIVVVGVDGVPDARKAILAGRMTASVAQLPYLIGKRSVELAKESVHGQCSGKTEKTPLLTLTKNVLELASDPLLKYVR